MSDPRLRVQPEVQIFVKPFFLDRVQHRHAKDEFLVFLGASFPNVFDFDADIEFTLGKLGEDEELYHINKPPIIRIPAGVYHCPLNFKRVDKPVLFLATLMTPMFGGIYDMPDGTTKEMYYNGPIQCKFNENMKCGFMRQMPDRGRGKALTERAFYPTERRLVMLRYFISPASLHPDVLAIALVVLILSI
jgi:hypothetical protein